MNYYKWTFAFVLVLSTLSVSAQVNLNSKNAPLLNNTVERAVIQATTQADELDPSLLIRAETLFQLDREKHGGYAAHSIEYYYNLLNRQHAPTPATPENELSEHEMLDAETELAFIRNTWDSGACFEKYPYLLDPAYRRTANEQVRQQIRQDYKTGKRASTSLKKSTPPQKPPVQHTTHRKADSAWARKVGI